MPAHEASLAKGATGDAVKTLQEALNKTGATLQVDGEFGQHTEDAVKAFQTQVGIVADGIAGPDTQSELAKHA